HFDEEVLRPDDMIALRLRFFNFRRSGDRNRISKVVRDHPGYLVVMFPPQAVLERAFLAQGGGPDELPIAPAERRIGVLGDTRLVFQIPKEVQELELSEKVLLSSWGLRGDSPFKLIAPPPDDTNYIVREPARSTSSNLPGTAIEVPVGVVLRPSASTHF